VRPKLRARDGRRGRQQEEIVFSRTDLWKVIGVAVELAFR